MPVTRHIHQPGDLPSPPRRVARISSLVPVTESGTGSVAGLLTRTSSYCPAPSRTDWPHCGVNRPVACPAVVHRGGRGSSVLTAAGPYRIVTGFPLGSLCRRTALPEFRRVLAESRCRVNRPSGVPGHPGKKPPYPGMETPRHNVHPVHWIIGFWISSDDLKAGTAGVRPVKSVHSITHSAHFIGNARRARPCPGSDPYGPPGA